MCISSENGFQPNHEERQHHHFESPHGYHDYYEHHHGDWHGDEGGHHGGHHGEHHHGGDHHHHEEEHHGHHEGDHHDHHHEDHHHDHHHGGEHHDEHHGEHHLSNEDSTEGSGDGEVVEKLKASNKKPPSKGERNKEKHIKEYGTYVHDGKSNKVEFSEEDQNPYHKQNKGELIQSIWLM